MALQNRIRAAQGRLIEQYSVYEESLKRDTLPRTAAYSFLRRARSIDRAIWTLLDANCIPEGAILLRSQLNLLWCFLFMVDARSRDGRFEFEEAPDRASPAHRRMARYMSWHWVDLHRRNPSSRSREMIDRFIREHGFGSEAEIPKYWYREPGIQTIKDVANAIGGLRQYEEDYTHLSGIEHTDITASIVQELCGSRYGDFIAVKSSHAVVAVLDFAIKICGGTHPERYAAIVEEFNALADAVARRVPDGG